MHPQEQSWQLYALRDNSGANPTGPSRLAQLSNQWVQPWSDYTMRHSQQPGTLVVMENHFAQEGVNGQYGFVHVGLSKGWALAARECIQQGLQDDPRKMAALAMGIVKVMRTKKGKLAAAAVELLLIATPIPFDEAAGPAAAVATVAIGGAMAVGRRRKQLNSRIRR